MKSEQLRRAIGGIDAELVEAADRAPLRSRGTPGLLRRVPRVGLIAAVLALLLSFGAGAYYLVAHQNTAALLEAGPMSNGSVRPELDETGLQILDNAAIDLGLAQQSNGTTVRLDSLMGYQDPRQSLLYLTFTVIPPAGYEFPEDMKLWCFWDDHFTLVPDDIPISYAASTVRNPDGSASVLWVMMPMGDPSGHRLHIKLGGFGTADKEVVASLYDGSREIELGGSWEFDLQLPRLPETREISLDAAALREAGLPLTGLRLNSFGGVAELEQAGEMPRSLKSLRLIYPEGREYSISFGEHGDNLWLNWDETGSFCQILFLNPQPIREAEAIVIDGVTIPLK